MIGGWQALCLLALGAASFGLCRDARAAAPALSAMTSCDIVVVDAGAAGLSCPLRRHIGRSANAAPALQVGAAPS